MKHYYLLKLLIVPLLLLVGLPTAGRLSAQTDPATVKFSISAAEGQGATVKFTAYYTGADWSMVYINTGGTMPSGKMLTIIAQPMAGYTIDKWVVNGREMNRLDLLYNQTKYEPFVKEDLDIVVYTKKAPETPEYEVRFFAAEGSEEKVTFEATANGNPIQDGALVQEGSKVVIKALPAPGCTVLNWMASPYDLQYTSNGKESVTINSLNTNARFKVDLEGDPLPVQSTLNFAVAAGEGTLKAVDAETATRYVTGAKVNKGTSIRFTAEPKEGWEVYRWTKNNETIAPEFLETDGKEFVHVVTAQDVTVKVYFKQVGQDPLPETFVVNYSVKEGQESMGAVKLTDKATGDEIPSGQSVPEGTTLLLTVTPNKDYEPSSVKINDVELLQDMTRTQDNAYTYEIADLTGALDIVVAFNATAPQVKSYKVTFTASEGGSLKATVDGNAINSGDSVEEGKEVLFTAVPASSEWVVEKWTVNVVETQSDKATFAVTVKGDTKVQVTFKKLTPVQHVQPAAPLGAYIAGGRLVVTGLSKAAPVEMIAITGQTVRAQVTATGFGVSDLANGIYLVKVAGSVFKVIKR